MPVKRNRKEKIAASVFALVVFAVTFALCAAFEMSDGGIGAAFSGAVQILLFPPYLFGILVISALCASIVFGLSFVCRSRYILSAVLAVSVLLTCLTAVSSMPLSRFREFVDESAPADIAIIEYKMMPSFSDGSWRTFSWRASKDYTIQDLTTSAGFDSDGEALHDFGFASFFDSMPPEGEMQYFTKAGVAIAYHAESSIGYALCR